MSLHPEHGVEVSVHGRHIEGRLLSTSMACGTFVGWHGALAERLRSRRRFGGRSTNGRPTGHLRHRYTGEQKRQSTKTNSARYRCWSPFKLICSIRDQICQSPRICSGRSLACHTSGMGRPSFDRFGETAAKTFTRILPRLVALFGDLPAVPMSYRRNRAESDFRQLSVTRRPRQAPRTIGSYSPSSWKKA